MSLRLDWNETFSMGFDRLDAQHRQLFEIANAIPETVDEHAARTCIVRLFKYTREHFLCEEAQMRKLGYPKLMEHIEIHNQLLEQLSDIALKPLDRDEANLAFKQFVLRWIVDHIMMADKEFGRFAEKRPDGHPT
jgi:hemerythrin